MAPRAISSFTRDGPFVDEHPHGVDVAQPGAGRQRVGQVEVGGVGVAAEHGGHAALGPAGGGLLELGLGEHADPHAVDLGGPHRGRQPGHAGAEHEQVEVRRPRSTCLPAAPGPAHSRRIRTPEPRGCR